MTDEKEKQLANDHDTLLRVEGNVKVVDTKIDNLILTVNQSFSVIQAQVAKNSDDIFANKLDIDRLKTGLSLTRWFGGALVALITLFTVIWATFIK